MSLLIGEHQLLIGTVFVFNRTDLCIEIQIAVYEINDFEF